MIKAYHPFEPIVFEQSRILILGSFPSLDSFKYDFYYAHPRNQFWKILNTLYHENARTKEEKIALLKKHRLALWDIVASCERTNSSDANLKNVTPNDIPSLLKRYPSIKTIAFTGKKAYSIYRKHYKNLDIETRILPSPSPAYAAMSLDEKIETYDKLLRN